MKNHSDSYVVSCPVGCNAPLQDTTIRVAEGALRRCTACGQLLSRAQLTLGEDDLGTLLTLGLCLARHGPLHGLGKFDILHLYDAGASGMEAYNTFVHPWEIERYINLF